MKNKLIIGALALAVAGACGDKKAEGPAGAGTGSGTGSAAAAPLPVPPLGVDAVKRFNYVYGPAQKDYDKVTAALKAKPRDWAAIKAACEATLAKDADHLDARWWLGVALAQTGDGAGAATALAAALAGDWLRWGPGLEADADLAAFLATPPGAALKALSTTLRGQVADALAKQPLLLARRSGWKAPKPGTGYAATRGELYAYDDAAKRYLRVTHTDHSLAGYLRGPSGELLLVGFSQAEVPDPAKAPKTAAPTLTRSWVSAWSPSDFTETSPAAKIAKARLVTVGYGPGEQILVATAPATGRWSTGPATTFVVDRGTGKLTKAPAVTLAPPALAMTLEDVVVDGAAAWPADSRPGDRRQAARGAGHDADPRRAGGVAEQGAHRVRRRHRSVRDRRRRGQAVAVRRRRQDRRVQARAHRRQPLPRAVDRRRSADLRGRLGRPADLRRGRRARGRQARRARRAGPRHAAADRGAAVPQRADRRRSRRGRRAAAGAVRPAGGRRHRAGDDAVTATSA